MGQHKQNRTPHTELFVDLLGPLTPEEKALALNELRKKKQNRSYTPNLPSQVLIVERPARSFSEQRALATCRNPQYGPPHETTLYQGQTVAIRDEFGLSLDPLQWADVDCACVGRGFVQKLRPMTAEAAQELLNEKPESAGSVLCCHGVAFNAQCRVCGVQRDREGVKFVTAAPCRCTTFWYQKARAQAQQKFVKPAFTGSAMLEALENRRQLEKLAAEAGVTRIQCQHKRSIDEGCIACGRTGATKLDDL